MSCCSLSKDPVMGEAITKMHFKFANAWEREIALHIKKKPWWMPRFLQRWMLCNLLVQHVTDRVIPRKEEGKK